MSELPRLDQSHLDPSPTPQQDGSGDPEQFKLGMEYRRGNTNCCAQGHVLQTSKFNGGRECDVCCHWIAFQSDGLACKTCEYDVCSNCVPASSVNLDLEQSFSCLYSAATAGHAKSQYLVGFCYESGQGVAQSDADAFKWLQLSAAQGNAGAQYYLSRFYRSGTCVDENIDEYVNLLRIAAESGHPLAICSLADCYFNGEGVAQSDLVAFTLWQRAAALGDDDAHDQLGYCYANGRGVEQSHSEALKCYFLAADQGNCSAQYSLGNCYSEGHGVDQNPEDAARWFKIAADQNYGPAQCSLGLCYLNGEGVAMDASEAFSLFKRAADNNFPNAEYYIGMCYANGIGVELDVAAAAVWYQRAAESGVREAEESIRELAGIVVVDRHSVLQSSLAHFNAVSDETLLTTDVVIKFKGEEGIDRGGLFNEWMSLITKQLFCPPLFLPVIEKKCLTGFLRLNPMPMPFFPNATDCNQRLRLAGIVLGLSLRRNVPLGIDLAPALCKLLLGEDACFEDLRTELPDEYEWMSDIKNCMKQAACESQDPTRAADARLHVADEEYRRLFQTPSRRQQVWQCIDRLKEARPDAYGDMLRLFEEECLHHSGRPDDDEVSSFVPSEPNSPSGDAFVSGSNFEEYVLSAVRKQLCTNLRDVMSHIYPSFQAAARTADDDDDDDDEEEYGEIPPEELRARLGDISAAALQKQFSGENKLSASEFVKLWKDNSTSDSNQVVDWFWEILEEQSHDYRMQAFHWSSGRAAFPVDIPEDLVYEIQVDSDADVLPTTHACIGLGQITLPSAVTKEALKQKLDWALDAGQSFECR